MTDVHYFVSAIIAKYEKYIANLEWHEQVNRLSITELEKIETQIGFYREVIRDFKLLYHV